ncbi:MAG: DUF4174 domain-containing protein [Rhodobacteraceae bacterium]|nr:DUF4174 domain-containing protein [Paracoccaceae bacterium]
MARILIVALAAAWPAAAVADSAAAATAGEAVAVSDMAGAAPAGAAEAAAPEQAAPRGTPEFPYDGSEVDLADFLWTHRPVVVFADTPADPAFQRQMELLRARPEALAERDVVVIVDTDPAARSPVRTALRPRGFMLAILGKDGRVEQRKPSPWDVREISRAIDRTPLRRQEIRERGAGTQ